MASRTQLRLGQITGSFGDSEGSIVDNLPVAATLGAIPAGSGSMVSVLSQLASSIQRIHGGTNFTTNAEGVFTGRIQVDDTTEATNTTDGSLQTDGGLSVAASAVIGDDLDLLSNGAIINFGAAQKFTATHANENNTLTITANHRLAFGDAGDHIRGDGNDLLIAASRDMLTTAANKITFDAQGTDAGDGFIVVLGTDNANSKLSVTNNSAAEKFSVNAQGDVNTEGDLTVAGNFVIKGDTTLLTSSNTVIQDGIIGLATSGSEGYGPSGADRGIIFAGGALSAKQPAIYFDGSASKFVMATQTVSPSSSSFPSSPAQGDLGTLILSEVQFAFDGNDKIVSDGTDLEISTAGNLNIVSTVNEEASIYLRENAGTDGTIKIQADQGTGVNTKGNSTDASIALLSDVGGIGIYSGMNNENAIAIEANGGVNEGIQIRSNQGTGAAAFGLGNAKDSSIAISSDAGGVAIASGLNNERAILLEVDAGTNETLSIHSNQGTGVNAKGGSTDASINLSSDAGGIGLYSALNGDNAIALEANGGANETIQIRSNQGTGVATADIANAVNASIALVSDVGGIAALSGLNADGAIFIGADAGTDETVRIHSHQGTGVGGTGDEGVNASISLVSDAGGVAIASGLDNAASVYMKGFGFTFDGGDQNDSFLFNNSPIQFEQISAPSSTSNKLYNVGGDLFWNGSSVVSTPLKGVYVLTASHAVGVNFATDGNAQKTGGSDGVDGLATSDAQGKTLDVYVNGQLLVSGSDTEVQAGSRDYLVENATNIAFAFSLEIDDVVQVIKR